MNMNAARQAAANMNFDQMKSQMAMINNMTDAQLENMINM